MIPAPYIGLVVFCTILFLPFDTAVAALLIMWMLGMFWSDE